MVVAVESACHAQGVGQLINGGKAMRVRATGFVGDENVGLLALQVLVIDRKNRAAVRQGQSTPPKVSFAAAGQVLFWILENSRFRGCPHFAPKHPAQTGNALASDFDYAPMQIALGKARAKQVVMVGL